MHFYARSTRPKNTPAGEQESARPASTGEEWLGRNRSEKRKLWERLNPRSRRQLRILGEVLAAQQTHGQMPDVLRQKLSAIAADVERLVFRASQLLKSLGKQLPPEDGAP